MSTPGSSPSADPPTRATAGEPARCPASAEAGNAFGLTESAFGVVAGFLLATVAAGAYLAASHRSGSANSYGAVLCSLAGLWVGLLGAAVAASRGHRVPAGPEEPRSRPRAASTGRLSDDFGFRLRPWPDVPVGVVVGVAAQLALVPVLELPLAPFVHNLSQQVGKPAQQLTAHVHGPGLVVLALFVCVGSPLVEEIFFRGLLLRALLGKMAGWGRVAGPLVSILSTSLLFALAHFEAIQFLGLAGFGAVLAVLAWRMGRLGPGIVAHATFNAVAIVALALSH